MKKNKRLAWFLICIMCISLLGTNIGYIPNVNAAEPEEPAKVNETCNNPVAGTISEPCAIYNEATDTITVSYTKTCCEYVDIEIFANNEPKDEVVKHNQNTYVYQVTEFGKEYTFRIIPYNNATEPTPEEDSAVEVSCNVPNKKSTLQSMNVSYDMEEHALLIEWTGSNITSVDIYQDNVKIATVQDGDEYEKEVVLQELKTYQYRIVTFNISGNEGDSKTFDLKVDRYPAKISNVDVEYNPDTKQIELEWDSDYTSAVDILLNNEPIVTRWKESEYKINYKVQPGAQYVISFVPYNLNGTEGDAVDTTFSDGDFEVPNSPDLEVQGTPILDQKKAQTGFYSPAVDVIMEVQPGAVYEIYRATSDKKSAYSWLATITAGEEDTYTYRDSSVGINTYYYKVLRKIAEDDYISSETLTGMSEASEIEIDIPEADITGKLLENGNIEIQFDSECDYISGYDLYRKAGNGSYKKIATVASNSYTDTAVSFDTKYYYKAKAYYYDSRAGKKIYGSYSSVFTISNTIGELTMDVTPLSGNQVKISWTKTGNASKYEVYYKTDTPGDSYKLLTSTKKLSVKKTLKSKTTYYFLVKAYQKNSKGKTYFSEAQITYATEFAKPQGLAVTKTRHNVNQNTLVQQSTLKWKRVYKADGYYVEAYNRETGEYKTVQKIQGDSKTSCTVTDVVPIDSSDSETASTATYRVVAFKGSTTLASDPIDVVLKLGTPSTKKVQVNGSKVTIRWTKVAAAEKYLVYRTCGRGMQLVGETTSASMIDSTTKMGVSYTYYVQAVNRTLGCTSEYSNPIEYTRYPAAVKKLKATNKAGRKVVLKWNKVQNVDSYIIYYSTQKNGSYKKLATVKASKCQYTHTNLTKWRTYYYKIVTVVKTSSGTSAESKAQKASITINR